LLLNGLWAGREIPFLDSDGSFGTGSAIGAGAMLLLVALISGIRRLASKYTIAKKPQGRAASA